MKLGSLFDGSGGFPLAGSLCGIEPVWASEVEPYPIAVTKSRFPKMKHLGNICNINGAEIEPVDIITFGSPCQDLSVAGKRAGLKHTENGDDETTRSGLFMEAVRIIKEMREATNGQYPRWALWENVPGAFSSNKGEDFRVVCEELIKIAEPAATVPAPPKGGWPFADIYLGDGWSLAYRVFDAQYWGVPQRRRRIHLIADFRGGRAGEVLFKPESLRGYSAESREAWQGVAADAQNCAGATDREGEIPHTLKIRSGCDSKGVKEDVCYTLNTIDRPAVAYCVGNGQLNQISMAEQANTLDCMYDQQAVVYGEPIAIDRAFFNQGQNAQYDPQYYTDGTVPTLVAKGPSAVCHKQEVRYIVRRLTLTECARLQGFPDKWGHPEWISEEVCGDVPEFWREVYLTDCAIKNKKPKPRIADKQNGWETTVLRWYNGLRTDSAEYKMWGNGIALPPALYCMQGMAEALKKEEHND